MIKPRRLCFERTGQRHIDIGMPYQLQTLRFKEQTDIDRRQHWTVKLTGMWKGSPRYPIQELLVVILTIGTYAGSRQRQRGGVLHEKHRDDTFRTTILTSFVLSSYQDF